MKHGEVKTKYPIGQELWQVNNNIDRFFKTHCSCCGNKTYYQEYHVNGISCEITDWEYKKEKVIYEVYVPCITTTIYEEHIDDFSNETSRFFTSEELAQEYCDKRNDEEKKKRHAHQQRMRTYGLIESAIDFYLQAPNVNLNSMMRILNLYEMYMNGNGNKDSINGLIINAVGDMMLATKEATK